MAENTTTAFRFDAEGYFIGTVLINKTMHGEWAVPNDATLEVPTLGAGYWCKFNGKTWVNEKIPTSCAEAIKENFTCIANGPAFHNQEKKAVLESLVAKESDDYRTKVDDKFVESIEEITEEEKQAKEDEAAKVELAADIAAVREDMMTAIAIGDDEWLDELRTEYNELVNGGE